MNRRKFLKGAGGVGMVAAMSQLGALKALADTSSDYKALVCVFLFGGNDSNNMIIPYDSSSYTNYAAIRGGLALAQTSLVPLTNPTAGLNTTKTAGVTQFALHPALSPLKSFWDAGQLAVQFNIGPLAAPTPVPRFWPAPQPCRPTCSRMLTNSNNGKPRAPTHWVWCVPVGAAVLPNTLAPI